MEKTERKLPIRSLHDFLFEIDNEWNRFKTVSMLSFVISLLLFILSLRQTLQTQKLFSTLFTILLTYTTYSSWKQYTFYRKWEKRIGLILHLEEELLGQ
jgi:hypothetical protein